MRWVDREIQQAINVGSPHSMEDRLAQAAVSGAQRWSRGDHYFFSLYVISPYDHEYTERIRIVPAVTRNPKNSLMVVAFLSGIGNNFHSRRGFLGTKDISKLYKEVLSGPSSNLHFGQNVNAQRNWMQLEIDEASYQNAGRAFANVLLNCVKFGMNSEVSKWHQDYPRE